MSGFCFCMGILIAGYGADSVEMGSEAIPCAIGFLAMCKLAIHSYTIH